MVAEIAQLALVDGREKIGRIPMVLALLPMVLFPLHHPPPLLLPLLPLIPHLHLLRLLIPLPLLEDAMFAQLLARSVVELAQRREILLTEGARNM
jgi:hypothetical protein